MGERVESQLHEVTKSGLPINVSFVVASSLRHVGCLWAQSWILGEINTNLGILTVVATGQPSPLPNWTAYVLITAVGSAVIVLAAIVQRWIRKRRKSPA